MRHPALLLGAALLAACDPRAPGATRDAGARADTGTAREAREAMLFTVASQFGESAAALTDVEFERVTGRDGCLEVRRRARCVPEATPGYRLRLTRRGGRYEYRAPAASPTDVVLAHAPDPRIGAPALAWHWEAAPTGCQTLLISADARPAVGWCDGPVAAVDWLEGLPSRDEWRYLHARYAPFRLVDGDRALDFVGAGTREASPAWRRAIMAWAALRWSELRAGRSGAGHGRAMAWRRPLAGRPGWCDVLEVTEYGVAYAGRSRCEGGGGEPGRTGWLSDALWEEFEPWRRRWGVHSDEATGLHFFGAGGRPLGDRETRALTEWAERALAHVREHGAGG